MTLRGRPPRWGRAAVLVGCLVALLGLLAACGPAGGSGSPAGGPVHLDDVSGATGVRGVRLDPPVRLPGVTLTDTAGRPWTLPAAADGRLTLLFFGYTSCPDICPTTVADLAAAVGLLTPAQRDRVRVVVATTDPARDTGPVLRHWLDQFDRSFVGLTGPVTAVTRLADTAGVTFSTPTPAADGTIVVPHGSQVTAIGPDGVARVGYLAGTAVADYAHDIPLLLAGES
ncbi:SCO family protein [Frankia sp. AvcI1]|uniref:SCO family protein n=1 Tax=Frankia sp. AvcI1 TaxID=573496 RepID=UPI0006EC1FA2|nr:SCO family protein [Frankia sp. AvcI1]